MIAEIVRTAGAAGALMSAPPPLDAPLAHQTAWRDLQAAQHRQARSTQAGVAAGAVVLAVVLAYKLSRR